MSDVYETLIKEEVKKAMEYCITAVTPIDDSGLILSYIIYIDK